MKSEGAQKMIHVIWTSMFSYYFIFRKKILILYTGFSVGMEMDVGGYREYKHPNLGTYTRLIEKYDVIMCLGI